MTFMNININMNVVKLNNNYYECSEHKCVIVIGKH